MTRYLTIYQILENISDKLRECWLRTERVT